MKVYNTLSRKKEVFRPRKGKNVQMFVCGVTPYSQSHIGHARTYIAFDVIVRYLKYKGFKVFYLQNITDVDDKIIKKARELKLTPKQLASKYTKEFFRDMDSLNIRSVNKYAPATKYMRQILNQIQRLMKKGFAYETSDGIYYDISRFKDYGKLSGRTILEAEDAVSRIDESITKRNKGDFALWKFYKRGEPFWKSQFGNGRPGWHIEDTAITETEFGPQYDIHGGARELIFPHHEAEIAQIEAASGKKPLVKYWMHTGVLNISGKKMSKSLGNFITIQDALKKWSVENLRLYLLFTHYRSPINFAESAANEIQSALDRLSEAYLNARDNLGTVKPGKLNKKKTDALVKKFEKQMDDDFNTPRAIAALFDFAKYLNKESEKLNKQTLKYALNRYVELTNILGILQKTKPAKLPKEIKDLVNKRERARKAKNFALADKIRNQLKKKGYSIQDSDKGPLVRLINE